MSNCKTFQTYGATKQVANSSSLLEVLRMPARLNTEQVAQVLGFQSHDIPVLVKSGLLKPLGGGPRNCVKFFAAFELEELCHDRKWLDRATKAISRRSQSSIEVNSFRQQHGGE